MTGPIDPAAFWGAQWTIERRVTETAGAVHHLTGTAQVDGAGLYSERGILQLAQGGTSVAQRRYRWVRDDTGIEVFFEDGRPFHRIDLSGGAPGAQHWCDPDTYNVAYDFSHWPKWSATWQVTGPRKDYVMVTTYTPS